jgi:hypothetical protein
MPSCYQILLWKQEGFLVLGSFLETCLFDSYVLFSKGPSSTMTLAARNTMLNALPAPILLDIAIIFTALSWGLGLYLVDKRVYIFASLAVGCFVCLFGYSVASLGAPLWAVVAAPVPLDLLLLWYVLRKPRKMAVAYVSIWAIYIVIHILLSALLRYDSLIPAWRLHS